MWAGRDKSSGLNFCPITSLFKLDKVSHLQYINIYIMMKKKSALSTSSFIQYKDGKYMLYRTVSVRSSCLMALSHNSVIMDSHKHRWLIVKQACLVMMSLHSGFSNCNHPWIVLCKLLIITFPAVHISSQTVPYVTHLATGISKLLSRLKSRET